MGRPADEVYNALKKAIQTGRLAPGEHLVEDNLRTEYGVSRTPVRNALRRLAENGLVTIEANRGAFVASWTSDDAAEVMSIRALLEPHAAALAAERRSDEQLNRLLEICATMEECERRRASDFRDELARQNHELHTTVLESAASPRLYSIAANLTRAPLMVGSFQFYSDEQLFRSLREHRDLVAAIEARDAASARAVMEAHLRQAYRTMTTPAPN
ncbi:GntR family transcriptional regulator [Saccharopolyspora oryzae]|uniref:GntR family transcriptional regulator n=1 Tax=Saccharopolyspora oryzae TaxID=2997343 RepID=A0ABT4UWK4_9PSEU|nr:GntR family transcriptional regulator [Saccharopolyspora oryzae]MDA3626095.1 GntR family transcriptional regulator [Saccharopolyspora oryzae]